MNKFLFGLIIGAVIAFPLGVNLGKDKPLLSNPFAERPLGARITDNAREAIREGSDVAAELVEKTREAVHEATAPKDDKGQ
jgi:hypothetical protein